MLANASESAANDRWYRGKLPQLDALRGIAILLVLAVHSPLGLVFPYAWCGVDLFFVLSGFLITGILLDSDRGDCYFLNFYARRALRIWPLYYLMVALGLAVLPRLGKTFAVPEPGELLPWYLFFVQNHASRAAQSLVVTWSLAIEEQFYLIWPLLVYVLPRKILGWVVIAVVFLSPALRWLLLVGGIPAVNVFRWSVTHCDGLAAGAAMALIVRSGISASNLGRWSARMLILALLISAVTIPIGIRRTEFTSHPILYAFGFSGLAVGFAALLGLALASETIKRLLDNRLLRRVGTISYGLYLYHAVVFLWVRTFGIDALAGATGRSGWLVLLIAWSLAIIGVFGLAEMSFRWFERPFLELKRYFDPRNRQQPEREKSDTSVDESDSRARSATQSSRASW